VSTIGRVGRVVGGAERVGGVGSVARTDDEGAGQKTVLAGVVHDDGAGAAHEDAKEVVERLGGRVVFGGLEGFV
jgi:hypothetical protein